MSLRVANVGLDLMAEALRAQDVAVETVEWKPPAGGDPEDVALLTRAYGDAAIDEGNARAVERLKAARPELVDAGPAGELIPGLEGRMLLHAGPAIEAARMCAPQRLALAGACVLEGWADSQQAGLDLIDRGDVEVGPAHGVGAAGAMTGVISPSMAAWHVRDEVSGTEAWTPFNDGGGEAFWLGVGDAAAVARQRSMAEVAAPAFRAALGATGPLEVFPLLAEGLSMGDDCHMRHQATTMLLARALLPALAEARPDAAAPTAALLAGNGHFALTLTIAAARAALEGIRGVERSSLVTFISRNGVDAAIEVAGLPGRWFSAPAEMVGDALYRPGLGDADAARDIGDSALVECCGLGAAASAASPSVAAFLGGSLADAVSRTRAMGDITVARSEVFRMPLLDGEGTPLGVDARACVDLQSTPLINTGILHHTEGGQIGAGVARTPLAPFRDALAALVAERG